MTTDPAFGVYVHVPFCRHRCDYCAFATYTDRDHLMEAYVVACVTEVHRAIEREGMPAATSVFFGGGTPSRLPAYQLVHVLDAIPRQPGAEVTPVVAIDGLPVGLGGVGPITAELRRRYFDLVTGRDADCPQWRDTLTL